jgi:hypothetical protein
VATPIRAACEQRASRSGSRGESRDRKPSPARWAWHSGHDRVPCSISSRALVARPGDHRIWPADFTSDWHQPHCSPNFLVEVFHFRGPLNSVGLNYFKEPRLFAARKGDGCVKDRDHPMRHPRVHLPDRASGRRRRGCARQEVQFGRGQDTELGWSDPTFVATETVAVAPAQQVEVGINTKRVAPACGARVRREPVKSVRIAHCTLS